MASIDDILTLAEAAELLGLSPDTLRNQLKRGRLGGRLIGKTYVTTREEVERYRRESLGNVGRPQAPLIFRGTQIHLALEDDYARAATIPLSMMVRRSIQTAEDLGWSINELVGQIQSVAATLGMRADLRGISSENAYFDLRQGLLGHDGTG